MAQGMETESNAIGVRESLADLIAVVQAPETPFSSMIEKRKKPINVLHDWQMKQYKVTGHKGVVDGKDASNFNYNPRVRIHGVVQKTWDLPAVSDFTEEVEIAGVAKGEMANQIADAIVAVKWQIEKRLLSNEDCKLDNGADQGNETRGLLQWINSTAQSLYPVPAGYLTPAANIYSGALASFTEASFLAQARSSFKIRKGPTNLDAFLGIDLKAAFSDFSKYVDNVSGKTPVRQFKQDADSEVLINVIDKLVLDTGEVDLHPTTFLYTDPITGADTAYTHLSGVCVDMNMLGLAYTRMPRVVKLEYKGGGYKAIVDAIFMLMVDNATPHLKILCNS